MARTKQATPRKSRTRRAKRSSDKTWSSTVATVSTHPPEGTFTKDAQSIARIMARKSVSPRGLGSAIRMVQFFINRAGKDLSPQRCRELEKAKRLLQESGAGRQIGTRRIDAPQPFRPRSARATTASG